MIYKTTAILFSLSLLAACGGEQPAAEDPAVDLAAEAQRIADTSIIVDMHVDVPYRLEKKWVDVSQATSKPSILKSN